MIQMNNTMLELFMAKDASDSRIGVYLFDGQQPTKTELNEFMSATDVKQLAHWKAFIESRSDTPKLIGELAAENLVNANFQNKERIVVPFAGDPTEMVVKQTGNPTWMIVQVVEKAAAQSDMYFDSWGSDVVIYSIVGSVGAIGSGADIEIVDGEIVDGNTYKLNNLIINLSEQ